MHDLKTTSAEAIVQTLAAARAMLACFGVRNRPLEAKIEAALDEAHALQLRADVLPLD